VQLELSIDDVGFGTVVDDIVVPPKLRERFASGVEVFDMALGGKGLTPSVCMLFTGTPGAGKTSMLLSVASGLAANGNLVVYNSAEESAYQVKLVYDRLGLKGKVCLGQETSAPELLHKFRKLSEKPENAGKHCILIVDSLQAITDGKFSTGRITCYTAERVLEQLTAYAKETYCNVIVVGQVNKSGAAAGTNKLAHMVDARIHMNVEDNEKSDYYGCRHLVTVKNRFGGGMFSSYLRLNADGFVEVARNVDDF
jgi:DNA repair protein RadA/Sms